MKCSDAIISGGVTKLKLKKVNDKIDGCKVEEYILQT